MTFVPSEFIKKRLLYLEVLHKLHDVKTNVASQIKNNEGFYKSSQKISSHSEYHYRYYKVLHDRASNWNEVVCLIYDYSKRALTQETIMVDELLNISIYESTKEEFHKAINELLIKD